MSLAKYMQFYKNSGFFAGSKIKVFIADETFYGSNLIVSKDGNVIATSAIVGEETDIYTDDSGILDISAENSNGDVVTGTVEITAYGTYYAHLSGTYTDRSRYIYKDKEDITLDEPSQTDSVKIAYTGDISDITAISDDDSVIDISVEDNVITVINKNADRQKKCTVTATVAETEDYDSAEINFNVNVLTGIYGTWQDATDDVIVNMINMADNGEIDLAEYWNIGDTRKVHLNSIAAGSGLIVNQPEQEIELVLMHYTQNSGKYVLTEPMAGGRKVHPSFAIGLKDCLVNRTSISYIQKTYTQNGKGSYYSQNILLTTFNHPYLISEVSELESWLNTGMHESLPLYIQQILKNVNVRFVGINVLQGNGSSNDRQAYIRTSRAIKSQKIVLPSSYEICEDNINIVSHDNSHPAITGNSIYRAESTNNNRDFYYNIDSMLPDSFDYSYEGELFSYYENEENRKKKRGNTSYIPYLTRTFGHWICGDAYSTDGSIYRDTVWYDTNAIINEDGIVGTYNMDDTTDQYIQRGISPIMFI